MTFLVLVAAVAVVYQPALNGGFLWDDDEHVTKPEMRSMHGLWKIWFAPGATEQYYPLLHSVFWVEHRLWGDSPLGHHVVNILLHAFSAVLVAMILRKLKIPGAYLAAGVFALHPVCVESVAWITELKNTLSAAFYLGTILAYLHFDERRATRLYVAALGLFLLALLSKTTTVTLPGALLVIFWWQRGRIEWRRDVAPLLPFLLLGVGAGAFTLWVEQNLVGAKGVAFDLTFLQRCLLAGRATVFYLSKLFWPTDLIFVYPRWEINPAAWWQYLFPAGVLGLLIALWAVRRTWRAPLGAMLYFIGTLLPLLGFFSAYLFRYTFVADHFQYLACLGVIVVASAGIALVLQRLRIWGRWEGHAACGALLLVLAVLSWRQSRMYENIETLYRITIDKNPACWMAHSNLGNWLTDAGRGLEAVEHQQEAVRLRPQEAHLHYNLGWTLSEIGRIPEAIAEYREALRLKPDYPHAYNNLGRALLASGRIKDAIAQYQEALRLDPAEPEVRSNLGIALFHSGRIPEAIEQYRESLRLRPNDADVHNNLGVALLVSGQVQEAIEQYQEALRLNPRLDNARSGLERAQRMLPPKK